MKCLKHSPEWGGPLKKHVDKNGKEITFTPYSRMTSLQVHVKGTTKDMRHVEGRYGVGAETLFVDLGTGLANDFDAYGRAKYINEYMMGPKMPDEYVEPR
jgi:hypothetical protein